MLSTFRLLLALFCLALAGAWAWSYVSTRGLIYRVEEPRGDGAWLAREYGLLWGKGNWIAYRHESVSYRGRDMPAFREREWIALPPMDATTISNYATAKPFLGVRSLHDPQGGLGDWLIVPAWWPVALTAIGPLAWVLILRRQALRRRRRREGLCINCGYDLRASTGACPECGAHIPPMISRT